MDLARIRKKLKESREKEAEGSGQGGPGPVPAQDAELTPAETGISASQAQIPSVGVQPAAGVIREEAPAVPAPPPVEPGTAGEEDSGDSWSEERKTEELIELLVFRLASEDFAFRVPDTSEIIKPMRTTGVPRTDPVLLGVSSLRGEIIPVIDLKRRFCMPESAPAGKERIIILRGPKGSVGVLVDRVLEVLRVPLEEVREAPSHLSGNELKYIDGITLRGGRFISVIRTAEILNFFKEAF